MPAKLRKMLYHGDIMGIILQCTYNHIYIYIIRVRVHSIFGIHDCVTTDVSNISMYTIYAIKDIVGMIHQRNLGTCLGP